MTALVLQKTVVGVSPHVLALRELLAGKSDRSIANFTLSGLEVELKAGTDSLWVIVRRAGQGGLALRTAFAPAPIVCEKRAPEPGETLRISVSSPAGEHMVIISSGAAPLVRLRATVEFTPAAPMIVPFIPRDLYPLNAQDDPLGAVGTVEPAQRGLNGGLLYFHIDDPAFGEALYFQNLTALNGYFEHTGTKPEAAVGGCWPELGYLPPVPPQAGASWEPCLPAGEKLVLSDAILVFSERISRDERESALRFIQMLGAAYKLLDLPSTAYRDWVERANRTLSDLDQASEATIRHYGHRYLHPYTDAEYPDVMVQMSIVAAIHDWGKWLGAAHPLEADFRSGLRKFWDPKLKTLRRYLPNVGKDKDADAVDSWYLYHPLLNLGRLALDGDRAARRLFLKSLDFAIRSARHFNYEWPIQYRITDFSVITEVAAADGRGQTDVGGVYAWVMLQAFELTDDKRYLDEARAALDQAMGLRFDINYQANLTAWGAAACMRLWRITNRDVYLEQSYVYIASFLHHCEIWESDIGLARHYRNFLGATCLQDAPYMAIYECFDAFTAFEHLLDDSGPDFDPAARMLVGEYCRYAIDRAWYYYPDALPQEAISPKQRKTNGHMDRKLSFPLEDLYPDGQQAGQVGQEIYGAGAALVFATRAFHRLEGDPFLLYCDQFVRVLERTSSSSLTLTLDGGETCSAGLSLVRTKRKSLPKFRLATAGGDLLKPRHSSADRIDYRVPANGRIVLQWD